jgi:hypothetical protein
MFENIFGGVSKNKIIIIYCCYEEPNIQVLKKD